MRAWAFKHPTPDDFIRLMRDQSGMDLDWFFREWLYGTARLDQAVDSVRVISDSLTEVYLSNRGQMVMPVTIAVQLLDTDLTPIVRYTRLPVEAWNLGPRFTFRHRGRETVLKVTLDPDDALPDIDRANNVWTR
jgi:hypothetical protein